MIPGQNILNMALQVIGRSSFEYFAFKSRAINANGIDVATYKPGRMLSGSVQPVPRTAYHQYGLDLQKAYMTFYVSKDILELERDVSADQIVFVGSRYQCIETPGDWFHIDGWKAIVAVRIPDAG